MKHEQVSGHAVASFARASPDETAGAALARIAAERPGSVELVLVVRRDGLSLTRAGLAPLLGGEVRTGPASTVVQDVCTIFVYFAIVRAFL